MQMVLEINVLQRCELKSASRKYSLKGHLDPMTTNLKGEMHQTPKHDTLRSERWVIEHEGERKASAQIKLSGEAIEVPKEFSLNVPSNNNQPGTQQLLGGKLRC